MSWSYSQGDPGISLFTVVHSSGQLPFPAHGKVLEIGCCEADWLGHAHRAWPELLLYGVDTALKAHLTQSPDGKVAKIKADVRDPQLFCPSTYDRIVSLSAIEHVGLGHYRDPKDPDGDTKAIANAWRWLKPGGYLYFDVPYDPTGYRVLNTECRIYDDDAIWHRLWQEPLTDAKCSAKQIGAWYVDSKHPDRPVEKPSVAAPRYWYAAFVWQKVG